MSATLKKLKEQSDSEDSDFEGPTDENRWTHLPAKSVTKSVKNFRLHRISERQVLFPKWRENYLKSVWNYVKDYLKSKVTMFLF